MLYNLFKGMSWLVLLAYEYDVYLLNCKWLHCMTFLKQFIICSTVIYVHNFVVIVLSYKMWYFELQLFTIYDLLILILEKEPVFPFSMLSAKQGNYWYHFITSLVWRGPWLRIEPGTSRTQCHHYTTRLSWECKWILSGIEILRSRKEKTRMTTYNRNRSNVKKTQNKLYMIFCRVSFD